MSFEDVVDINEMTEQICECGHDEARHFFNKDKSCDVKYCRCKKFKKRQGKGIIEEVLNWTLENLSGSYSEKNEKVLRDAFEVVVNETSKKFTPKNHSPQFKPQDKPSEPVLDGTNSEGTQNQEVHYCKECQEKEK